MLKKLIQQAVKLMGKGDAFIPIQIYSRPYYENYSWQAQQVVLDKDGKFRWTFVSGCSCDSPKDLGIEVPFREQKTFIIDPIPKDWEPIIEKSIKDFFLERIDYIKENLEEKEKILNDGYITHYNYKCGYSGYISDYKCDSFGYTGFVETMPLFSHKTIIPLSDKKIAELKADIRRYKKELSKYSFLDEIR